MSLIRPLRLLGSHIQAAKKTASFFEGLVPSIAAQQTKTKTSRPAVTATTKVTDKACTATAPMQASGSDVKQNSSQPTTPPKFVRPKSLPDYKRTMGAAHADGVSLGPDFKVLKSVDMRTRSMAYSDGVTLVPDFEVTTKRDPLDKEI